MHKTQYANRNKRVHGCYLIKILKNEKVLNFLGTVEITRYYLC